MIKQEGFGRIFNFSGSLNIYGNGAINPDAGKESAAASANHFNSPAERQRLLTRQQIIHSQSIAEYTYKVVVPTAPQTPSGLMLIVHPTELQKPINSPQFIYDLPNEVQHNYWKHLLAASLTYSNMFPDDFTFCMENIVPTTSSAHRTSRTLHDVHAHICRLNQNWVNPDQPPQYPHMSREQTEIKKLMTLNYGPISDLVEHLDQPQYSRVSLNLLDSPYGYGFTLPPDCRLAQNLMADHWSWYKSYVSREQTKTKFAPKPLDTIPGPSFCQFVWFDQDRQLNIAVSPEFHSSVGALIRLNIDLIRSPDGKIFTTPDEDRINHDQFSRIFPKHLDSVS